MSTNGANNPTAVSSGRTMSSGVAPNFASAASASSSLMPLPGMHNVVPPHALVNPTIALQASSSGVTPYVTGAHGEALQFMRARGTTQTVTPRNRVPLKYDPFVKCCSCSTPLSGYLTETATTVKTTVLSCGHVVCPECCYKWRTSHRQALRGNDHAGGPLTNKQEPLFKCQACQEYVVDHVLPSKDDAIDRACEAEDCRFRDRFPCSLFCNHCRVRMCNPCGQQHIQLTQGHNVIQMRKQSMAPSVTFSKRHISCKTHNIVLKYRCSCGEVQCEKCQSGYETILPDNRRISHHKSAIHDPDLTLEDSVSDTVDMHNRLAKAVRELEKAKERLRTDMDILSNEICLQMNQLMLMCVKRAYDVMMKMKEGTDKRFGDIDKAIGILNGHLRRIDVGLELDERTRDLSGLSNNAAADVYRAVSYSILRPVVQGTNSFQNCMNPVDKILKHLPKMNFEFDTTPIMEALSTWGEGQSTFGRYDEVWQSLDIKKTDYADHGFDGMPVADLKWKDRLVLGEVQNRWYPNNERLAHLTDFVSRFERYETANIARQQRDAAAGGADLQRCTMPPSKALVADARLRAKQMAAAQKSGYNIASPIPGANIGAAGRLLGISAVPTAQASSQPQTPRLTHKIVHIPMVATAGGSPAPQDPAQALVGQARRSSVGPSTPGSSHQPVPGHPHTQLVRMGNSIVPVQMPPNAAGANVRNVVPAWIPSDIANAPPGGREAMMRQAEAEMQHYVTDMVARKNYEQRVHAMQPNAVQREGGRPLTHVTLPQSTANKPTARPSERSKDSTPLSQSSSTQPPPIPRLKIPRQAIDGLRAADNGGSFYTGNEVPNVLRKDYDTEVCSRSSSMTLDDDDSHAFCLVCRDEGNDLTEKGCCDKCPRVFHGKCHVPAITGDFGAQPDDWKCSICTDGSPVNTEHEGVDTNDVLMMSKVMLYSCVRHRDARYFIDPVDEKSAPGYHAIIKQPMCMRRVMHRIKNAEDICKKRPLSFPREPAYRHLNEFYDDMNQVFKNCSIYNPPESVVAMSCRDVWNRFQKYTARFLPAYTKCVWMYVCMYRERLKINPSAPPAIAVGAQRLDLSAISASAQKRRVEEGYPPPVRSVRRRTMVGRAPTAHIDEEDESLSGESMEVKEEDEEH